VATVITYEKSQVKTDYLENIKKRKKDKAFKNYLESFIGTAPGQKSYEFRKTVSKLSKKQMIISIKTYIN
jgi:hypothetical protein